jgi:hypothetical protein
LGVAIVPVFNLKYLFQIVGRCHDTPKTTLSTAESKLGSGESYKNVPENLPALLGGSSLMGDSKETVSRVLYAASTTTSFTTLRV